MVLFGSFASGLGGMFACGTWTGLAVLRFVFGACGVDGRRHPAECVPLVRALDAGDLGLGRAGTHPARPGRGPGLGAPVSLLGSSAAPVAAPPRAGIAESKLGSRQAENPVVSSFHPKGPD